MKPEDIDLDLLEFIANDEPWHILCPVFYYRYPSPKAFVHRIKKLEEEGYLRFLQSPSPSEPELLDEARRNDFWDEEDVTDGPWWDVIATDRGFALVKGRFEQTSDGNAEKPPGVERES